MAAATAATVLLGVGAAQNRLPAGVQDVVSSTAELVGIHLPHADERGAEHRQDGDVVDADQRGGDGQPGYDGVTPGGADPADPGVAGDKEPATPATPPDQGAQGGNERTPSSTVPEGPDNTPSSTAPADPAQPERSEEDVLEDEGGTTAPTAEDSWARRHHGDRQRQAIGLTHSEVGQAGRAAHAALGSGDDVRPREAVGRPQPVERGVRGVGEAVPVAELVEAALALDPVAQPAQPAHAVDLPGHGLREREVVLGGRVAERRVQPVVHLEEEAPEDVDGAVRLELAGVASGPRARRSRA